MLEGITGLTAQLPTRCKLAILGEEDAHETFLEGNVRSTQSSLTAVKRPPVPHVILGRWHILSEVSGIDPPLTVWRWSVRQVEVWSQTISLILTRNDVTHDRAIVISRIIDTWSVNQARMPENNVSSFAVKLHRRDVCQHIVTSLDILLSAVGIKGAVNSRVIQVTHVMGARPDCKATTVRRHRVYKNHCRQLSPCVVSVGSQMTFSIR